MYSVVSAETRTAIKMRAMLPSETRPLDSRSGTALFSIGRNKTRIPTMKRMVSPMVRKAATAPTVIKT
jgi:hypothetical protein